MNMKKKIVTVCLVACMALTAVAGGTLAYFTDTKTETNTFTVGNVELKLEEPAWDSTGAAKAKLVPGREIEKDPTISVEDGSEEAWVFAEIQVDANMKALMTKDGKELVDGMKDWFVGFGDYAVITQDDPNKVVLSLGKMTDDSPAVKLFEKVKVPTTLKSEELETLDGTTDIVINAKAIQTEGIKSEEEAYAAFTAQK